MKKIKLSPHHLYLFSVIPEEHEHKRIQYGESFYQNLKQISEDVFEGRAQIEIVNWRDDICMKCPYGKLESCIHPGHDIFTKEEGRAYEQKETQKLGVNIGDILTSAEIFDVLKKRLGGHLSLAAEDRLNLQAEIF